MKISNTISKVSLLVGLFASTVVMAGVTVHANNSDSAHAKVYENCVFAFNKEVADNMQAYSRNPTGDHFEVMKEAVYEASGNYETCTANVKVATKKVEQNLNDNFMVRFPLNKVGDVSIESKEPKFKTIVTLK
jgi:hypothetical protein